MLYVKDLCSLRELILQKKQMLIVSSSTSRSLDFEKFEEDFPGINLVNVSQMKPLGITLENDFIKIEGPITWEELDSFCQKNHLEFLPGPTEKKACVLAGVATSATGERSFGLSSLRKWIHEIEYMDFKGEIKTLSSSKDFYLDEHSELLEKYQEKTSSYNNFKNPLFPFLNKETDLMIGTEGQLGVIVSATFKAKKSIETIAAFLPLPHWKNDKTLVLKLFKWVQKFRGKILSCEFLDKNSMKYLDSTERPKEISSEEDLVFLEIKESFLEEFWSEISQFLGDNVFLINLGEWHRLRQKVPLKLSEELMLRGVQKLGTDVQTSAEDFEKILKLYSELSHKGEESCLFGHLGDAHLHFNFLPFQKEKKSLEVALSDFYQEVKGLKAVPFAEHGIGTRKLSFIHNFYSELEREIFQNLKEKMDPYNIFFPVGFMSKKRSLD